MGLSRGTIWLLEAPTDMPAERDLADTGAIPTPCLLGLAVSTRPEVIVVRCPSSDPDLSESLWISATSRSGDTTLESGLDDAVVELPTLSPSSDTAATTGTSETLGELDGVIEVTSS